MGDSAQTGRSHVDLARAILRVLSSDEPLAAAEMLDPDIDIATARTLAGSGRFLGQPGFRRWLERWGAAWDPASLRVEMVEPVGERHAVASVRQRQRDGAEQAVSFLFEFRSGLPVRLHAYASRRAALAAARDSELA